MLGEHVTDAIFIRNYLKAQGYDIPTVYQDNQAAIRLSENGVASSARTRHIDIDIRYFFIQDRIDNGDVKVECLNTKSMVAGYLTKPLVDELFYKLRAKRSPPRLYYPMRGVCYYMALLGDAKSSFSNKATFEYTHTYYYVGMYSSTIYYRRHE